jgi:hypothetical protein
MKKIIGVLLVIVLVFPTTLYLWGRGYFIMHDDLQVMRVFQMDKCFADGQIPCRWSPDMAYGHGQAMFNFYSAFPYYLGALIRMVIPLSVLATVKLLMIISLISGAIGMYLLAKEFWGRAGGVLSAVLYTYAPYHALVVLVRGALAESFALGILPFLWFFIFRVIKKPNFTKASLTAVSVFFLLTTHNISSMIYAPFTLLWALYWLFREKSLKAFKFLLYAGFLGLGLSAFFILPAIIEQNLIQTQHLTAEYSDYHAHFVTLNQLFIDRSWGNGASIFGPYDDLSFQIGWPHWWLAVIAGCFAIVWLSIKKTRTRGLFVGGLLGLFLLSAFLTHSKSLFIWEALPLIDFVQFPWRFLGLVIFFLSFAAGAVAVHKIVIRKYFLGLIIFSAIFLNFSYFKPFYLNRSVTDKNKLTGEGFILQQKAAILDYLPKTAQIPPPGPAPEKPKFIQGEGYVENYNVSSNRFSFDADVFSDSTVEIPVMHFPGWIVIVDNRRVESGIHGAHGVISVDLEEGRHIVRGRFTEPPIRMGANLLTIASIIVLFSGLVLAQSKKK